MSIYAIGDLHLSMDPKIDKPMDIYGGIWVDHARKVKENCEKKITDNDTLIIAGDISWALKLPDAMADLEWISKLPGKKVCFKGNHDLWWSGIKKLNTLFDDITFMQNDVYMVEEIAICGTRGWICPGTDGFDASDEKIYKRELIRLELSLQAMQKMRKENDFVIAMTHYPPFNAKMQDSEVTALLEKFNVNCVVYGHLHGKNCRVKLDFVKNGIRYLLTSCDQVDCKLVEIEKDKHDNI